MFRKIVAEQQSSRLDEVKASSNTDDSSSPSQDRAAEGRERQRLREQERRRREAVSSIFENIQLSISSIIVLYCTISDSFQK